MHRSLGFGLRIDASTFSDVVGVTACRGGGGNKQAVFSGVGDAEDCTASVLLLSGSGDVVVLVVFCEGMLCMSGGLEIAATCMIRCACESRVKVEQRPLSSAADAI